jgi:hypothetical protein
LGNISNTHTGRTLALIPITSKITWIQPYYDLILNEVPKDAKSILDVGAGYGINGFIMKKSRDAELYALEPFKEYDLSHYDFTYDLTGDTWYRDTFKNPFVFDVIVSTEMIEHMESDDAQTFLHSAKKRAKKVIIATPYEWEQQEPYDGNKYQVHKSLMTVQNFIDHKYKVRILGTITKKGLTCRVYCHPKWIKILRLFGFKPTNIIGVWTK